MHVAATKISPPPLSPDKTVHRPLLLETLDTRTLEQIVLVSAPAGFGKSTMLAQWIRQENMADQCAWISLEIQDNSPAPFLNLLIQSIHRVYPESCRATLALMSSTTPISFDQILSSMVNCLNHLDASLYIILDDLQLIHEPVILNSINFMVDHLPRHCFLIFSTREDPPLELSRLRVSGRLLEIRQDQLKFSTPEAVEFVSNVTHLDVDGQLIAHLNEKAEGWVAGLKLAMLSLKTFPGDSQTDGMSLDRLQMFNGKDKFVFDFLMEQVLTSLPAHIRTFMGVISFLDRFCAPLCRAVTRDNQSESHLRFMEDNNLFLVPLDNTRTWFRFHHLFRDCLIKIFGAEQEPGLKDLCKNASQWFLSKGDFQKAFEYGTRSEAFDLAVDALRRMLLKLYRQGSDALLTSYFKQLPETVVSSDPLLACYHAWGRMIAGDFDWIDKIKTLADSNAPDSDRLVLGFYHALEGYRIFFQRGDLDTCLAHCLKARESIPDDHDTIRRMLEHIQSICYRFTGDLVLARQFSRSKPGDDLFINIMSAGLQADIAMESGRLEEAQTILQTRIDDLYRTYSHNLPLFAGFLLTTMGSVLREKNRLADAGALIHKGLSLSIRSGFVELILLARLEQAKYLIAQKAYGEAQDELDASIELSKTHAGVWTEAIGQSFKARVWILQGQIPSARRWMETFELSEQMSIDYIDSFVYINLARCHILLDQTGQARIILEKMMAQDRPLNRNGRLLECSILNASALAVEGRYDPAAAALSDAFRLAGDQAYVRLFLDEWPRLEPVYNQLHATGQLPAFLIDHLPLPESLAASQKSNTVVTIHDIKEEFNVREIQILEEMQKGASNREIASALFLSVNTVRWYASRLFLKLDVKRRGEAVAKAMNIGII